MNADLIFIWGFAILFGVYGLCRVLQTAWDTYQQIKLIMAYDPSELINNITPMETALMSQLKKEHKK